MTCDYCERGQLHPISITRVFQYKGRRIEVPNYAVSECKECHATITTAEQARSNERLVIEAKREADGLLTSAEIKALRQRLGLSQGIASQVFGGGPHAFSKYERNEVMQSAAADNLMRIVQLHPDVLHDLAAMNGISLPWSEMQRPNIVSPLPVQEPKPNVVQFRLEKDYPPVVVGRVAPTSPEPITVYGHA